MQKFLILNLSKRHPLTTTTPSTNTWFLTQYSHLGKHLTGNTVQSISYLTDSCRSSTTHKTKTPLRSIMNLKMTFTGRNVQKIIYCYNYYIIYNKLLLCRWRKLCFYLSTFHKNFNDVKLESKKLMSPCGDAGKQQFRCSPCGSEKATKMGYLVFRGIAGPPYPGGL